MNTVPVTADDQALMVDVQEQAERQGLVLITDGRELRYTRPNYIPDGWRRFALWIRPEKAAA